MNAGHWDTRVNGGVRPCASRENSAPAVRHSVHHFRPLVDRLDPSSRVFSPRRVGKKGADAAFSIAQDADHDVGFQRSVSEHRREAYDMGNAPGQQVALLTDRVRVAEGTPQLYGTQAQFRNGEITFHSIQDSSSVDQRRAEMDLPPLSEYVEKLKEQFRK